MMNLEGKRAFNLDLLPQIPYMLNFKCVKLQLHVGGSFVSSWAQLQNSVTDWWISEMKVLLKFNV